MKKIKIELLGKHKNIICIMLSIISTILMYLCTKNIFFHEDIKIGKENIYRILIISFTLFSYFVWNTVFNIMKRIKNKDKMLLKFFKYFCIALIPMTILFFLIYPGYWVNDEAPICGMSEWGFFDTWHSILTQCYYSLSLLVFGHPIAIIVMQMFLIAMIIGYIQTRVEKIYNRKIYNIILQIIFCFPPIILHSLCAMRLCMYSFIVLLFISKLYLDKIENKKITKIDFFILSVLAAICVNWRTEGILFLAVIPFLLKFTYKKNIEIKYVILFVVIQIIVLIGYNSLIKEHKDPDYMLLNFVNPLSMMIVDENLKIDDDTYVKIDKVIDLELLAKYPNLGYTEAYYAEEKLFSDDYADDMKEFLPAITKLIFENFGMFFKYRLETYVGANSMIEFKEYQTIFLQLWLEKEGAENAYIEEFCEKHNLYPKNLELKTNVEHFITGAYQFGIIKYCTYNVTYIMFIIIIIGINNIRKKEWLELSIVGLFSMLFMIVFITEPAMHFRYFLPIYLTGHIFMAMYIFEKISKKRKMLSE